jgi:hypothetical protein
MQPPKTTTIPAKAPAPGSTRRLTMTEARAKVRALKQRIKLGKCHCGGLCKGSTPCGGAS